MAPSSTLELVPAARPCARRIPPAIVRPVHAISSVHGQRSAPHVCDCQETAARWRVVDVELSEVIGRRGTAAVLRQALVIARRAHGWLPAPSPDAGLETWLHALTGALANQRPEDCGAGRLALETTLHELLLILLGVELRGQLLPASQATLSASNTPAR